MVIFYKPRKAPKSPEKPRRGDLRGDQKAPKSSEKPRKAPKSPEKPRRGDRRGDLRGGPKGRT
jgi:hypothetical protein